MRAGLDAPSGVTTLIVAPMIAQLAVPLAWLTVAIEGVVAATHLLRLPRRAAWLRDGAMLLFVALTYLLVPVLTFGVLLAAMGLAQSELPERWAAALYLGVALLIAAAS